MLYYDRIEVSEGTIVNKTSESKEGDICRYWYFFQLCVCNGCHNVLMISMNLSNTAVLSINCADYRCIISGISKSETVNLLQKADLNKKSGIFQIIKIIKIFLSIYKNG